MVKKKQAENSPAIEPAPVGNESLGRNVSEYVPLAPVDAAKQLQDFVNEIKTGFTTIETNFEAINKRLTQQDQRIAAVAKTAAEEPHPTSPMDYFKTITDILNSPIVNTLAEKLLGATEEAAPANPGPTVDPKYAEMVMKEAERQNKLQDRWMEAMVQGAELRNAQLKKEIGSDLI